MSGHSKWASIKHKKGVADQKRGALFSKLSKKITVAVKEENGGSPNTNYKLKTVIDYAKSQGMPNDNVERAIKSALGGAAQNITEVIYEGYGPYGTAFLIETATDNTNRSLNEIKNIFKKNDGSLGAKGSVAWQFQTKGQILVRRDENLENIELAAIDAGAKDVREFEEGLEIYTKQEDLNTIKEKLEKIGAKIAGAEIIKESSQGIDLNEEQKPKVKKLMSALQEHEDVISVHTNANI